MSEEENTDHRQNNLLLMSCDPEDTVKILLATDCHLGYERSTKRAQEIDSLITFEEILQLAVEHEVDFILFGGDLFHDSKPPQDIILKCLELLRKYCLGKRDVKIQFLTDPEVIFKHCEHKMVNFEDENLNISIPIFSIHGNHDDPSMGTMGALDLLSSTGFINYFGKWTNLTNVSIPPIILKKGKTFISLYGLSYVNDKLLSRLIRDQSFKMLRAKEIPESFNMFVLHQNRVCHAGVDKFDFIREESLPSFLNFIMWGHEHECRINPEYYDDPNYWICQPGSSVATSLSEGESVMKHVGLLSVNKTNFKLKALKLKTVRPFIIDNISVSTDLSELTERMRNDQMLGNQLMKAVDKHIENELIPRATQLFTDHPHQPQTPLIRLKVFVTRDVERFDTAKLSQKYCDTVANPMDMILFVYEKRKRSKLSNNPNDLEDLAKYFECSDVTDERAWSRTVQDGIRQYFEQEENMDKLSIVSVASLNEALMIFTESDVTQAFEELIETQIQGVVEHLKEQDFDFSDDTITKLKIKEYGQEIMLMDGHEDLGRIRQAAKARQRKTSNEQQLDFHKMDNDDNLGGGEQTITSGTGRSRGKRGRGRGKTASVIVVNIEEDGEEVDRPNRSKSNKSPRIQSNTKQGRCRQLKQMNTILDITKTCTRSTRAATTSSQSKMSRFLRIGASQDELRDEQFLDSD